MIAGWQGIALNQAEDSANEIHSDRIAQQFGFRGGLVPGVTISAYLIQPAVQAWGLDFLNRGTAHVRVTAPLYDGEAFEVCVLEQDAARYKAEIRQDNIVSATGDISIQEPAPIPPQRRGDKIATKSYQPPVASKEVFERLQAEGCLALRYHWREKNNEPYVQDIATVPELLRSDGGGYASMNFLLGCSNWALAGNAHMNPWMHLETRSQNYRSVPSETTIVAELAIRDLFEKKGHKFVNVDVNLFDEADDACVCAIELRAIYKLRGA
jgi:hypothetical protein